MSAEKNENQNREDAQVERNAQALNAVYSLVAAKVPGSAIPTGRNPAACNNEFATDIDAAEVPTADHAACNNPHDDNRGSLQHTPTTWIGNEQFNRPVGGGA